MATIRVLMCGGHRIGKTSIMAAIQKNVQEKFPSGDIVLDMEKSNSLVLYRKAQEEVFGPEHGEDVTWIAATMPTMQKDDYRCRVYLKDRKSDLELSFTDIPGEWFLDSMYQEEVISLIKESQILVIAIDSPHLMEKEGKYHQVFNRAALITEEIQKALQGSKEQRMVLFVPLKCERYKNRGRMGELLSQVKEGYGDLVGYLTAPERSGLYTIGVTPVITMGGMEFLRFLRPVDEEGNPVCDSAGLPLKDVDIDKRTGRLIMNWMAQYQYLTDAYGDHYYEPKDCEQPLIYILLFLIAMGKQRNKGFLSGIWAILRKLPDQKAMEACIQGLLEKRKAGLEEGFAVLNDPIKMLGGRVTVQTG